MKKRTRFFRSAAAGFFAIVWAIAFGGAAYAGNITPPDGEPSAKFYTLSEIYNFITNNTTATEGTHDFTFQDALAGSGRTLSEIYAALAGLISADQVKKDTTYLGITGTLVPSGGTATASNVLSGKTFFGDSQTDWSPQTGTMANNGAQTITPSTTNQAITAGFHNGSGYCSGDTDLVAGKIKKSENLFGITGTLFGDTDASKVLTTADGGGAAKGTYDASSLTTNNVRYGTAFGAGSTGTFSPYPNTPSGITGLNQTVCASASWTWVADSDYDGASDDPICVSSRDQGSATTKLWNMSGVAPYNVNDNTFIGNYGCSGDTDGNGVGTLNETLAGTVSENAGYGDDANTALAIADCKDGIRNLLTAAAVESFGYTQPNTTSASVGYNGPLTPKDLFEWKGTRLPSSNDFFGFCGDGTLSKTAGDYGVQLGRTDSVSGTASQGSYEWLSEQHDFTSARVAGLIACSYFNPDFVTYSYSLRVVFRP